MTDQEKIKEAVFSPEGAFLENDPIISPVDMSSCIISRTKALVKIANDS